MIPLGTLAAAHRRHDQPPVDMWTPEQLSSPPALWFDDDSGAVFSETPSDGTWFDKSGNGLDASSSGSAVPALELSPWRVEFGPGEYLNLPSGALGIYRNVGSAWGFSVFRRAPDGGNVERPIFLFTAGAGTSSRVGLFAGGASTGASNRVQFGGRRTDSDSFDRVDSAAPHDGSWVMALGMTDYSTRTISLHLNGALDATKTGAFGGAGNTSNTQSSRARLGANGVNTPTTFMAGDVRCVLAGVELPDSNEVDRIFGWAAHHFGLTSLLPLDHPYKDAPPPSDLPPATVESMWIGAQS